MPVYLYRRLSDHERRQDFGPTFIALARAVYITNDRRAAIKRQINERLGSQLIEEKSYTDYGQTVTSATPPQLAS